MKEHVKDIIKIILLFLVIIITIGSAITIGIIKNFAPAYMICKSIEAKK